MLSIGLSLPCFFFCVNFRKSSCSWSWTPPKLCWKLGGITSRNWGLTSGQQLLDHIQPENQWIYPFGKVT